MSGVIVRAVEAFRSGGAKRLRERIAVFGKRRYFRVLSKLDRVGAEIELLDPPAEVVAGCMYRTQVRLKNLGRTTWNAPEDKSPRFAIAARFVGESADPLEGPHIVLRNPIEAGETAVVEVILEVPRKPGAYRIQIDLVRENCYWLAEIGRPAIEVPVRVSLHSDELLGNRIPAVDITLDVTNKCPLKCIQCRKTYFENFDEQQDMNFELFKKIAAEAFPYARSVVLSSAGEPLMTRNFLDAVALTRSYGVDEVSFITSGFHLNPARTEKLIELGVSRIEFSIDGATAPTYDKIRIGSKFDKVIQNIEYLNSIKKKHKTRKPLLRFNFVLMKSNIHELPAFIDLAARLGVEEVQTQHMVIFVENVRDEALVFHKAESNRNIEMARQRAQFHGIRFFHPPLFKLDEALPAPEMESSGKPGDGKIWFEEESGYDFERKTHPAINDGLQLCTDPWRKLYVDWQGQVFPCCVWKEAPMGDLRKSTFPEIWESVRYKELRGGLTSGNLGKSCSECSVITGGDIDSERSYFFS